jgi:hypothetical protein
MSERDGPWTCFHCGETFTDFARARDHFGANEFDEVACKIAQVDGDLVAYARSLELQLDLLRSEEND